MSDGAIAPETPAGLGGVGLSLKPTCLIVEDQALLGLALEAYLEEVGFGDCEVVLSSEDALEWLVANTPTMAILDYNLKDGPCAALVEVLRERGIAFLIYSGHQRSIAPPALQDVVWLCKPCDRPALLTVLTQMVPDLAQSTVPVAACVPSLSSGGQHSPNRSIRRRNGRRSTRRSPEQRGALPQP